MMRQHPGGFLRERTACSCPTCRRNRTASVPPLPVDRNTHSEAALLASSLHLLRASPRGLRQYRTMSRKGISSSFMRMIRYCLKVQPCANPPYSSSHAKDFTALRTFDRLRRFLVPPAQSPRELAHAADMKKGRPSRPDFPNPYIYASGSRRPRLPSLR